MLDHIDASMVAVNSQLNQQAETVRSSCARAITRSSFGIGRGTGSDRPSEALERAAAKRPPAIEAAALEGPRVPRRSGPRLPRRPPC